MRDRVQGSKREAMVGNEDGRVATSLLFSYSRQTGPSLSLQTK